MKEWIHDQRQEHLAAKHEALAGIDGADQIAYREVMRRVQDAMHAEWMRQSGAPADANVIALEVLSEAVEAAHAETDPHAYAGSVAFGVVKALRALGASPAGSNESWAFERFADQGRPVTNPVDTDYAELLADFPDNGASTAVVPR